MKHQHFQECCRHDSQPGRMSKSVQYMVTCGSCGNLDDFTAFRNQREAEAHYRSLGWSKTDRRGWVCPECRGTET